MREPDELLQYTQVPLYPPLLWHCLAHTCAITATTRLWIFLEKQNKICSDQTWHHSLDQILLNLPEYKRSTSVAADTKCRRTRRQSKDKNQYIYESPSRWPCDERLYDLRFFSLNFHVKRHLSPWATEKDARLSIIEAQKLIGSESSSRFTSANTRFYVQCIRVSLCWSFFLIILQNFFDRSIFWFMWASTEL